MFFRLAAVAAAAAAIVNYSGPFWRCDRLLERLGESNTLKNRIKVELK